MSTRPVFKASVNQSGRALSLGEFRNAEIPPAQLAERLAQSDRDRLAVADSIGALDRDLAALENGLIINSAIRARIDSGRVELYTKNIDCQASVTTAGALLVRLGSAVSGRLSVAAYSQTTSARELYFPISVGNDAFILECRTNTDVLVNLNIGSHILEILLIVHE